MSIRLEATAKKSVKDEHRIEQLKRKFAQVYMQSAWKDFVFINTLKANNVLSQSNQNKESFELINDSIDDCVDKTNILIVSNLQLYINYNGYSNHLKLIGTMSCSMSTLYLQYKNVYKCLSQGKSSKN